MKKAFILLAVLSLTIVSCEKDENAPLILPSNPQQPANS